MVALPNRRWIMLTTVLCLPALTVTGPVEVGLHQSATTLARRPACWPAVLGRNPASDPVPDAAEAMVRFAVVSGVDGQPFQSHVRTAARKRRPEIAHVGLGPLARQVAQHHVIRAIDQEAELRLAGPKRFAMRILPA